jgi:hypothetical protein
LSFDDFHTVLLGEHKQRCRAIVGNPNALISGQATALGGSGLKNLADLVVPHDLAADAPPSHYKATRFSASRFKRRIRERLPSFLVGKLSLAMLGEWLDNQSGSLKEFLIARGADKEVV